MTTPGRPISARDLNAVESSARSAHPGASSYLVAHNGAELALRNPRRAAPAVAASAGGLALPAIVTAAGDGVYVVDLYANGIGAPPTGTATLSIPEVSMLATLPVGAVVLAHPVPVPVAEADEDPEDGEEEV